MTMQNGKHQLVGSCFIGWPLQRYEASTDRLTNEHCNCVCKLIFNSNIDSFYILLLPFSSFNSLI